MTNWAVPANSFYKHPDAESIGLKHLCAGDSGFMIDEPRAVEWHRIIATKLPTASSILNPDTRARIRKCVLYRHREVFFDEHSIISARTRQFGISAKNATARRCDFRVGASPDLDWLDNRPKRVC